ncbi:MAG: GDSL-type esterase/lipase family protein, partial [Pseudomonadota bacterium]|nr:GDSL-type esterase/lipase family protein [Pseudomonadota bacterium]
VVAADDARPIILAIGESTTAGFGVPAGSSYPAQLQALLDEHGYNYRVVNHGRSGSTTAMALANLDRGVALLPRIVLIALGGNDRGNPATAARTEENLRKMVSMFVGIGAQVYLADRSVDTDGGDAEHNSLYARIADEERATLMPSLRKGLAGREDLLLSDMSHPNADGYAIVAQRIFDMLEPVLRAKDVNEAGAANTDLLQPGTASSNEQ